jgi:hypothetical protein
MADDRYIELINKEISGTITPSERDDLHKYLRENPDAQRIYRELRETCNLLNEVSDVEPPANLRWRIMDSVDFGRYEAKRKRPVLEFMLRAGQLSLRPRLAYVFALGVVVGLVVYSVLLTRPMGRYPTEIGNLYGTIGVAEDVRFTTLERIPVDSDHVKGWIELSRFANVLVFEVSLRNPGQFEIFLEHDSAQASLSALRPGDRAKSLLETAEGYLRISGSGDSEFHLSLIKKTAGAVPIDLKLLTSGELLMSHRFVVASDEADSEKRRK